MNNFPKGTIVLFIIWVVLMVFVWFLVSPAFAAATCDDAVNAEPRDLRLTHSNR